MAARRNDDVPMSASTRRTTDENANSPSNYSEYLAYTQYWQYYNSYSFYYYSYYYYILNQQRQAAFQNSLASSGTLERVSVNGLHNLPDVRRRVLNGGPTNAGRVNTQQERRYEYAVASLWRRAFAEFIDFVFLFFIKYLLFFLYYKDPDQLNAQIQYILVVDETTSFKDIEDVLVQALVYRLIVFLYEAFFLAVSFPCSVGGATFGKYMMGITVISYQGLTPVEGQLRRFSGSASRRLFPWRACVRAILKNFMITFFFPIMFTAMFLQNYRTPYDFMANSIVVDAHPKRQRQT